MKLFPDGRIVYIVRTVFCVQLSVCLVLGMEQQNATHMGEYSKQFDMVLRFDGSASYNDNNAVVRAGKVLDRWSSKCRKSKQSDCKIREFNKYEEQVFFQFSYDNVKNFNFRYPTIKTSGGRAKAHIIDYSHDLDEKTGEIIITHDCEASKKSSNEQSKVELLFPLTSENILEIGWTKECGCGDHQMLDYGFVSRQREMKGGHVSLRGLSRDDEIPVFNPAVLSTRVYLKHEIDGYSQRFSNPTVRTVVLQREGGRSSNSKGVSVDVKGSAFGEIVLGKRASVFDIFYNCHTGGVWRMEVEVNIVPFNKLRMKWIKDCGGGAEKGINIGTREQEGVADVVSGGVTLGGFGSQAKANEKGAVLGKGSGTKAFFLWTTESNRSVGSISIAQIGAHSYNEGIATAEIAGINKIYERARWGIGGIGEHGETVDGAVKRILGVKVECKRKGKVRVGVTMSVHDRDGIEWWFYNECKRRRKKTNKLYVTAGMVTYIMMGALGAIMMVAVRAVTTTKGVLK